MRGGGATQAMMDELHRADAALVSAKARRDAALAAVQKAGNADYNRGVEFWKN
jgi:hypothetical protein